MNRKIIIQYSKLPTSSDYFETSDDLFPEDCSIGLPFDQNRIGEYAKVSVRITKPYSNNSINPSPQQIYVGDLIDELWHFNRDRRQKGKKEVSHATYVDFFYGTTVHEFMNRPFDVKAYYKRFAIFNNNHKKRVK